MIAARSAENFCLRKLLARQSVRCEKETKVARVCRHTLFFYRKLRFHRTKTLREDRSSQCGKFLLTQTASAAKCALREENKSRESVQSTLCSKEKYFSCLRLQL